MRSVRFEEFGSPKKVLDVVEIEKPEPGPGQVRVKLSMSPIHNHDLMTIAGLYGIRPALPAVPGTEAVGVVDAVGEGVTGLGVGQRVVGGNQTWAEYYLLEAARAIPVPDAIPDEIACQMISMPLSALMLIDFFEAGPGDWIIQNAANGAVGKMLAQFGAERGVNVVSLVRRAEAVDEMKQAGVANLVSTDTEGWQDQVRAIVKDAPLLHGLDSVGGRSSDEMLALLSDGGTLVAFGAMSGRPLQVTPNHLLFGNKSVKGFWLYRLLQTADREWVGHLIGELIGKAARGELKLPVGGAFDIADIRQAAIASDTAGRKGKIVLTA